MSPSIDNSKLSLKKSVDKKIISSSSKLNKSKVVVNKIRVKSSVTKSDNASYGTGKRKNSIARVWVSAGKGEIIVNYKNAKSYFQHNRYISQISAPLLAVDKLDKYDIFCTVKGGGLSGQSGAIKHGVSKALAALDSDQHRILRKSGFLTRDARVVERKKYGHLKARKVTQYSKR